MGVCDLQMTPLYQEEAVVLLTVKNSFQTRGMLIETTFIAQVVFYTEPHCSCVYC